MGSPTEIYEKLGVFYLGREYDLDAESLRDDLVLYDSKDLTTHAVCVGMTGSGKTGLCVDLLEEAAIDGVPALVIDPKGDLANLLLTFPDLAPADFRPWVNEDDARRRGLTADKFAAQQAKLWKDGLASWDQDGERIRRLRAAADFTIFTPGSEAGVPVSVLSTFAAPPPEVRDDADLYQDRIRGTATSLLGLLGIDADPIRSREHILLCTLLDGAWSLGQSLDLGALIALIQNPPVNRIGVLDLESFFPSDDRFEFAIALNNLLAAPGFASWMSGEPLDVDSMLYAEDGKPRVSIFSIAHLSDAERMFFVSMLLNEVVAWMRTRPGTTSLRALVYMDEIFGFMPPVAEPPSKKPLLTLLKQARAFGVGVVLATQNPVDLDYKGLSNCGTWFLGRLQTDRDKARVLDGLSGVNAGDGGFDRVAMEATLSALGKRVFLMHNVHESGPVVFQTRWAMSYLRGPLTRAQIKRLTPSPTAAGSPTASAGPTPTGAGATPPAASAAPPAVAAPTASAGAAPDAAAPVTPPRSAPRPIVPPDVLEVFLPVDTDDPDPMYRPRLIGMANVTFVDTRKGLEAGEQLALMTSFEDGPLPVDWAAAEPAEVGEDALADTPVPRARFADLPDGAADAKSYARWRKSFSDWIYRNRRYELLKSPSLREISRPGESERDFRIRLADRAREERDRQLEKLRLKYASKFRTLRDRIRSAEAAVERESDQASGAKMQTAISLGATLLSAVLGRSPLSSTTIGKATTAARGAGRASRQARDVDRAREKLEAYQQQLEDLEAEFQQAGEQVRQSLDPMLEVLDTVVLKPRRADVDVRLVALAWTP